MLARAADVHTVAGIEKGGGTRPQRRRRLAKTAVEVDRMCAMTESASYCTHMMLLEPLVNEMILDDREPGSFDPVAAMRRKLSDDILKSRFHILELERHRARVRKHMDRLGRRKRDSSTTDVLGSMLRARSESIGEAIRNAEDQIEAIEQAYTMLEGYAYELEHDDRADEQADDGDTDGKAAE